MRRNWIIALLLAALTLALYWPVRQFDLIYFDDPLLLTESPEVQARLTWASVKWAFTSVVIANWQPVTNLSFLAVSQFFGTAPGPHHLANRSEERRVGKECRSLSSATQAEDGIRDA